MLKTMIEKDIFETILNIKSSEYSKISILNNLKGLKKKKIFFLKLLKIQNDFLQEFKLYLLQWRSFLKKIKKEKKLETLFFLFIYKYLDNHTNREKSLKKACKLFFGFDDINLFKKNEMEKMLEELNKKFDLNKVFEWFFKNKKTFKNFDFDELEKIVFFNKFQQDNDLDILHKFTKSNFKHNLFSSIEELIIDFLTEKKQKKIKYRCKDKKKILKGIKEILQKTNLFGFNDFFEKILKV